MFTVYHKHYSKYCEYSYEQDIHSSCPYKAYTVVVQT
jgi:hypothetical protein